MSKTLDKDFRALKGAIKSLNLSSRRGMLAANIEFLTDYFLRHPAKHLPKHLRRTP